MPPTLRPDLPHAYRAVYLEARRLTKEQNMPHVTFAEIYEREQGQIQGQIKGLLRGLEVTLRLKFKEEGLALMPQARLIDNPERLDALLDQVQAAATLDDVRNLLS